MTAYTCPECLATSSTTIPAHAGGCSIWERTRMREERDHYRDRVFASYSEGFEAARKQALDEILAVMIEARDTEGLSDADIRRVTAGIQALGIVGDRIRTMKPKERP